MEQFIFFNSRLTAKLNLIYHHPLTIVTGAPGVGKSFSISTYLHSSRADVIWHTSRAETLESYLAEFSKVFAARDGRFAAVRDFADSSDPAGVAVDVAARIKGMEGRAYRLVYVLEYLENQASGVVLTFLHYLSSQQIKGFYLILINRASLQQKLTDTSWSGINLISEDCFLTRPDEIVSAFGRNGIVIDAEEANYLYLCSAGYMPALAALFDKMQRLGRGAVYTRSDVDLPKFRFSNPEAARGMGFAL